jgi:hypothetical protein
MIVSVADIAGLSRVPTTPYGVRKWLNHHEIRLSQHAHRFTFNLAYLPSPVRQAFTERQIATAGLAAGTYDDDAHVRLLEAPAGMRAAAERAAAIARYMLPRRGAVQWADLVAQVRAQFGGQGVQ